jgi:hypothetical protein
MRLTEAVLDVCGVEVDPQYRRAEFDGWEHEGTLDLPCPSCEVLLELFGADLVARGGSPYRATALVCAHERAVWWPSDVPDSYREAIELWRTFRSAESEANTDRHDASYWAYVVELDLPGGAVYVGQSANTPDVRFAQHMNGYKASKWVRKHGIYLRPDLYEHQPPIQSRLGAEAYEAYLASALRIRGFTVKGGH